MRSDARDAISRLETSDASYWVVIEILRKQYEKKQLIINSYYAKLKKMQVSSTYYEKLQWTYDIIEKQLLLLEALGRNIEKKFTISLIQ